MHLFQNCGSLSHTTRGIGTGDTFSHDIGKGNVYDHVQSTWVSMLW